MGQKFAVSFNALGKVSSWGPVIEKNKMAVRIVSRLSGEEECWTRSQANLFDDERQAEKFYLEEFERQAIRARGYYTTEDLLSGRAAPPA